MRNPLRAAQLSLAIIRHWKKHADLMCPADLNQCRRDRCGRRPCVSQSAGRVPCRAALLCRKGKDLVLQVGRNSRSVVVDRDHHPTRMFPFAYRSRRECNSSLESMSRFDGVRDQLGKRFCKRRLVPTIDGRSSGSEVSTENPLVAFARPGQLDRPLHRSAQDRWA